MDLQLIDLIEGMDPNDDQAWVVLSTHDERVFVSVMFASVETALVVWSEPMARPFNLQDEAFRALSSATPTDLNPPSLSDEVRVRESLPVAIVRYLPPGVI